MKVDGKSFILKDLSMWSNINIPVNDTKILKYEADFRDCEMYGLSPDPISGKLNTNKCTNKFCVNFYFIPHK